MVALAANEITIEQQFYPQQIAFLGEQARYPAFVGGRNSGKTFTGAYKALKRAAAGGLGLIAGPSFPAMKLGPKPRFLKLLDDSGIPYRENKNDNKIYIYACNAEIQFAGLENDTYTRGPNYRWGWVDELDFVADPEMWRTAKAAVREGSDYQLFITSTPKGRRLIYQEWVVNRDDFHRLHKATSYDNFFVDAEDFVAGLNYAGTFYEQEINAEFVTFEGLVYPGFDRFRHVKAVDCAGWASIIAVDVGTRNPTAVLTIRHSGDRLHVARELYRRGMGSTEIVEAVAAEYRESRASAAVIDPSAAGLITDLENLGLTAHKGDNAIITGISRVTSVLPDLSIDPSCVNLIAEFESYQYPEGTRAEQDNPIKANDHALDALRYGCMELVVPQPKFFSVK
jgi:phage terminase large subunit